MKKLFLILTVLSTVLLSSCTENFSNGERIGYITKFSERGLLFKSYEGELNLSQTGMNSAGVFQFSLDNDTNTKTLQNKIYYAQQNGKKVKLTYHETFGYNWFENRGDTSHFITNCEVIE